MKTITIPAGQCIDSFLKRNREPGTVFLLGKGTYYTSGAFDFEAHDFCMLAPGCSLSGEGPFRTRIALMNPVTEHGGKKTGYVEVLTGGARSMGSSTGINMQGFRLSVGDYAGPTVAIHVYSSNASISDIHVEDVVGFREWPTTPNEGFGMIVENGFEPGARYEGGNTIARCRVVMRKVTGENYSNGISVGTVRRQVPLLRSTVIDCEVVADDVHCGYAFSDHVDIIDCKVYGARRAIFADTKPIRSSRVIGMHAQDVGWAMELRTMGGADVRSCITLEGSFFAFKHFGGYSQGILLCDDSKDNSGLFENVAVKNCTFVQDSNGLASKARLSGKQVRQVIEDGNVWVGNWERPTLQNQAAS
jgi:hypothetical protein